MEMRSFVCDPYRLSEGCAPSMGANLWGGSPLWEYRLGFIVSKDNHEPTARAFPRGFVWRKPECKGARRRTANRLVKAEGCYWRWHMAATAHRNAAYGKCGACAPTVRALVGDNDPARGRCEGGRRAPSLETRRSDKPRTAASGAVQRQPVACVETGEIQQGGAGHRRRDRGGLARPCTRTLAGAARANRGRAIPAAGGAKGGDTQARRRQTPAWRICNYAHGHRPSGSASRIPAATAVARTANILRANAGSSGKRRRCCPGPTFLSPSPCRRSCAAWPGAISKPSTPC